MRSVPFPPGKHPNAMTLLPVVAGDFAALLEMRVIDIALVNAALGHEVVG